jgi:hypothetical protein
MLQRASELGERLWTRQWTSVFHKSVFFSAERQLASQGLCSVRVTILRYASLTCRFLNLCNITQSNIIIFSCICVCVEMYLFSRLYAHALTIFIKDARWFNLFNKLRRRRSPDGSEFRNKFPYQQLKINLSNNWKFVVNNIEVHLYYICSLFYVDLIVFFCS